MSSKSSKTDSARNDLPETVTVGRVLRPHGVRGEVSIEVLSDVPGRFEPGSVLLAAREGEAPARLKVAAGRPHKAGAVVRFEGFDDRDRAEELRGMWLEVSRSEVPEPPAGTYYHWQLLGCRCRAGEEDLGTVVELLEEGGGLLLVCEREGRRVPVPFVERFLREVDVAEGRIELDLPPGLLEACASGS
ncbi:MAG TPA: ribosome maturation factor RimM [Thermoanaerobaculia bacterium]|nr:ribosome maturation factor RimM [Thermoanaerobaculia bacterium]